VGESPTRNNFYKGDKDMDRYQKDKEKRKEKYMSLHGIKETICGACGGSGYYDHNGSPKCSCCDGTGRERIPR
jgi:DnaJ-class molecular chaperone